MFKVILCASVFSLLSSLSMARDSQPQPIKSPERYVVHLHLITKGNQETKDMKVNLKTEGSQSGKFEISNMAPFPDLKMEFSVRQGADNKLLVEYQNESAKNTIATVVGKENIIF